MLLKRQIKNLFFGLTAGMLAAALSTGPAIAAEDKEESEEMEEVIVTATRRETNVMETPFSIQAFSGDSLERQNITEVRELYDYLPGITLQEENAQTDHTVQMRGSGISSVGADDGMSALGTYVDDIPYLDITSQVAPPMDYFDLNRIEVLRGPQGTSFGQDSTGGSIRMYTNDPDLDEFGFKAKAGYLNRQRTDGNGWNTSIVVNVPLVTDVFGLRGAVTRSYDPGFGQVQDRPDIKNPTEVDITSYRLKALWQPTEDVSLTLGYNKWDTGILFFPGANRVDTSDGNLIINGVTNRVALLRFPNGIPDNSHEIEMTSALLKWDLDFAELTATYGRMDAPNREFNWGAAVGILFNVPNESITQELRLVSTHDGPLQWLAGAYFQDAKSGTAGIVDLDFRPFFEQTYISFTPRTSEAWALYGELSYQFNDQWVVLLGLRRQEDDRVAGNSHVDRDPTVDDLGGTSGGFPVTGIYTGPTLIDETDKITFSNTHPRLNVTYYPNENSMVYLNIATAFRAPIFVRGQQKVDLEQAGLGNLVSKDGTEITSSEIGAKVSLMDGRLELQGAVAFADWKDTPVGVSWEVDENNDGVVDRNASGPISGASAEITSWEWQATWRATDQWTLSYLGAHIDGEISDDKSNAPGVSNYPDVLKTGKDIPNVADWTHSINIQYQAPLFDTGWQFYGAFNLANRSKPGAANPSLPDLVPAANDWRSARLTLSADKGPWTVDLSVNNLTDYDKAYTPGSSATINGGIPYPRAIELEISYDGFAL